MPDKSILAVIIIEVCARACEERVTVVSMASNASTDLTCKTSNKMCQRPSPCERVCRNWSVLVLRVRVTESVSGNQQKIVQNISICVVNHAGNRTCVVIRKRSDYFHLRGNRGATGHQACLIKQSMWYINSLWTKQKKKEEKDGCNEGLERGDGGRRD